MLLLLIVIGVKTNSIMIIKGSTIDDIEFSLQMKLQSDYALLYDYNYITLKGYSLVFPKIFDISTNKLPTFKGTEVEVVQQCIDFVNESTYSKNDSDPNGILKKEVGNCQAMSIILHSILDKHNIENDLTLTEDHMSNELIVNGTKYLVDLSNNIIQKE